MLSISPSCLAQVRPCLELRMWYEHPVSQVVNLRLSHELHGPRPLPRGRSPPQPPSPCLQVPRASEGSLSGILSTPTQVWQSCLGLGQEAGT